jgi:hypothetical protein
MYRQTGGAALSQPRAHPPLCVSLGRGMHRGIRAMQDTLADYIASRDLGPTYPYPYTHAYKVTGRGCRHGQRGSHARGVRQARCRGKARTMATRCQHPRPLPLPALPLPPLPPPPPLVAH